MKPQRRPRSKLNLTQRRVFVQYIDSAQLIQIEPRMRAPASPAKSPAADKYPQAESATQSPTDHAAAPPCSTSDRSGCAPSPALPQTANSAAAASTNACPPQPPQQKLPPRKDRHSLRRSHVRTSESSSSSSSSSLNARCRLSRACTAASIFSRSPESPPAAAAAPHPDAVRRPLRLRIKLAHRLDLIAKEIHANRPVSLRRIHIQNAATPRKLPRHLHQVHLRITHARQVIDQHPDVDLFAPLQLQRQPRVVAPRKQPQRHRLHRRNHNRRRASNKLPKHSSPLLLNIRMRRKILKRQHIMRRQPQHALGIDGARKFAAPPSAKPAPAPQQPCYPAPPRSPALSRPSRKQRNIQAPAP